MKAKNSYLNRVFIVIIIVIISASLSWAQDRVPEVYPTAILPFSERGSGVKGYGKSIADILFARLSERSEIILVERAQIEEILGEVELGLSGIVSPAQAAKIGQIVGAKVLLTGSVFEVGNELFIVAKVIGTETSRVLGKSVNGKFEDLINLIAQLSDQIADLIVQESISLIAAKETIEDRIATLNNVLGDAKRPVVMVRVNERHIGQQTIDPAAQTELILFCRKTGFEVVDTKEGSNKGADVVIEGEGFSEFAMRKGNLMSVKARIEIKAVNRATNKIIATERQTAVVVDLTEQIAGKKALQDAAAVIAERLLPQLVKK